MLVIFSTKIPKNQLEKLEDKPSCIFESYAYNL